MRRLILVANPIASGFTASLHREVMEVLTGPFHVTSMWPGTSGEARTVAAEAAEAGYDVVAAMGGDGVVHQVAAGLTGTDTALGIIPVGTTNVLARLTGTPERAGDAAVSLTTSVRTRPIKVAGIETDSPLGSRKEVVTFAAGVGFDAAVVQHAERTPLSKVSFGGLHYARSAARVLLADYRTRRPHLRIRGGHRSADAVAVLVQLRDRFTFFGPLGLQLGGPNRSGPVAVVVKRLTTPRTMRLALRAARSLPLDTVPGVEVWTDIETLSIEADPGAWVEADGELLGKASRVQLAIEPEPLLLVDQSGLIRKRRFSRR
jgi:diacylglycerol kinase family enzyme